MLMLLSGVFGFLGPFLPEVFKFLNRKADQGHERAMIELRQRGAADEAAWRMAEIEGRADIEEARVIHKPMRSYGVQLLDAAADKGLPLWLLTPILYAFGFLDFLAGMVRPAITYAVVGGYLLQKYARYHLLQTATGENFDWAMAVNNLWTEQDFAVLTLVLSYWFGNRVAKHAFGWGQKR